MHRYDQPPLGLDRVSWAQQAPIDDADAWRALVNLVEHTDTTGLALPSHEALLARCRTTDERLARSLRILERDGYLQRAVARSNGREMYRVLIPGAEGMTADLLPMAVEYPDLPTAWSWPLPRDGAQVPDPAAPTPFETL